MNEKKPVRNENRNNFMYVMRVLAVFGIVLTLIAALLPSGVARRIVESCALALLIGMTVQFLLYYWKPELFRKKKWQVHPDERKGESTEAEG